MLILQFKEIRKEMDYLQKQHEGGKTTKRKAIQDLKMWMVHRQAHDIAEVTKLFVEGWLDG